MCENLSVTVWNEYRHERSDEEVADIYPDGIHALIAEQLDGRPGIARVRTATLDEPEHGLSEEVLAATDVLIWWGHMAHEEVRDEVAERVHRRVLGGMGLVLLHSAHTSKVSRRLMGTSCGIKWREVGERARHWIVDPAHPVAEGLGECIELEHAEMYGEHFDIPAPDELVFVGWFEGGEIFRSGCCFHRGRGKIFYFQPGHETYPLYHNPEVMRVIYNACLWAAPTASAEPTYGNREPLEKIGGSAARDTAGK